MFTPKPQSQEELEMAITEATQELRGYSVKTPEYAQIYAQLERMYALRTPTGIRRVTPDTLAIVLGNLVGIAIIVGHERANVVTSKALNFVMKAAR